MNKPVDNLTLSAEDGEALMSQVHLSHLSPSDAETVEWVIRMYFYVVFALQEAKLSTKPLRALLFGKSAAPSPSLVDSLAPSPADSDEASASVVLEADVEAAATAHSVLPGESQRPADLGTCPKPVRGR